MRKISFDKKNYYFLWWTLAYICLYLGVHLLTTTTITATSPDVQSHGKDFLKGLWVGNYGSHGPELVRITVNNKEVTATKITGDINVPAGQITWRVNPYNQLGDVHCAYVGFMDDFWVACELIIVDEDTIRIDWTYNGDHDDEFYFHRVKEMN